MQNTDVEGMYAGYNYNWYEYNNIIVLCLYKCYFKEMLFQKKMIRIVLEYKAI